MLKNIIEALFFSAGRGLAFEEIYKIFENAYSQEEVKKP